VDLATHHVTSQYNNESISMLQKTKTTQEDKQQEMGQAK
jgi:hypothetical protein